MSVLIESSSSKIIQGAINQKFRINRNGVSATELDRSLLNNYQVVFYAFYHHNMVIILCRNESLQ